MGFLRTGLGLLLACAAASSLAQQVLEVIPLRHATPEQVIPALRPLLEPGGVLTGERGQLVVRASEANISDLRLALEVLDRPARRLQISVRFEEGLEASRSAIEASGRIGNRGSDLEVHAQDARSSREGRVDQRVQAVEGARAFIALSQSRPVMQRRRIQTPAGVVAQESFVMEDATSGFEVVPRLAGDKVFVEIASQNVATSASGRLGEWFELGATREKQVWIKVEEIRN